MKQIYRTPIATNPGDKDGTAGYYARCVCWFDHPNRWENSACVFAPTEAEARMKLDNFVSSFGNLEVIEVAPEGPADDITIIYEGSGQVSAETICKLSGWNDKAAGKIFSDPKLASLRQVSRDLGYKSEYSQPANIGSSHWIRTIVSRGRHCLQFIRDHPNHEYNPVYLKIAEDVFFDILQAQSDDRILMTRHNSEPIIRKDACHDL